MKVILVDPLVAHCTKITSKSNCFTGSVPIKVPVSAFQQQAPRDRDQDVTQSPFTIKIEGKDDEKVTVLLYSFTTTEGNCVLAWLRDRFQDRANISIVIWVKESYGERREFASMEGMQIEMGDERCFASGSSTAYIPLLDMKHNIRFYVTITADIPDECFDNCSGNSINRKMLETGSYSDVIIIAGNGAEIKAHKCVICTCSTVLGAMFQNDMQEAQTSRIEMIDMSEQGIRAFLLFLYCGDLKMAKEDPEIAFELLQASHKYLVSSLEVKMIKCLIGVKDADFSLGLAFKVYMFARNIESAVELKKKCGRIFYTKPDELESLEEYGDLFEETPKVAMEVCRDFLMSAYQC